MIDIEQIKAIAPPEAIALFSYGDGTVGFYKADINMVADIVGKKFSFAGNNFPKEKMYLAIKNKIGEWILCQGKYSEALKTLSKLDYIWIPTTGEWIKKEGI